MAEPTLFDEASLALIASGGAGKDGKVYSVKPVPVYGPESVTNGDFATDSDWTKGAGVTISGEKCQCLNTTPYNYALSQIIQLTVNKTYLVSYEILDYVSGEIRVRLGSNMGTTRSSNGVYQEKIVAQNTDFILQTVASSFTGSIDNVSVKEVLSGDGDFTFSRGSNLSATRVGADGLIEKGRENLLLQSNQFDTTWQKNRINLTSGQSGYDGGSDAWKLESNDASTTYLSQNVSASGVQTASIYAKAGTADYLTFYNSSGAAVWFNLSNGSLGNTNLNIDTKIESVGNGWYRCSMTFNVSTTYIRIYVADTNGNFTSAIGANIYIQSAQLEIGLAATDVISTGATTGKAGLLEDEPRFDYSGGATCPSLLLEPSRTNQIRLSEYFEDTTIYDLRSADIVTNYAISPEGVKNATKVIPQNGTTNFRIQTQHTFGVSGDNVLSVFAKYESGGFQYLILATNSAFQTYAFDIQNGTKVGNAGGATIADEDATIELIGNGWYRCSIKSNNTGIADGVIYLSDDGTNASATGDGSKGMLMYGFQGEANASYPTSYIPNHSGGSVTRGADLCNGAGDASTFNDNEGVLYAEIAALADDLTSRKISLNSGTSINQVTISFTTGNSNRIRCIIYDGSSVVADLSFTASNITLYNKIAIMYKSGDTQLWVNGVKVATNNSAFSGLNLSNLSFNSGSSEPFYGKAKQVLVFKEALSDTELIKLTTI